VRVYGVLVYSDYLLLTRRGLISSSPLSVNLVSAFKNERLRSDSSVPAAHKPELVGLTTGLIVRQQFLNARLDL